MRTTILLGFAALVLFSLGCDPKKDPATPQEQDFSCIKLFDDTGQTWGLHGDCSSSNDWGNIALSSTENALLNFSDTVSLNGTVAVAITQFAIAPCPVKIDAALHLYVIGVSPDQDVKLKLAIVDESLNVVQQLAIRINTGGGLALHIDPSKFESGKYYRMYYRVSASGAPSLYEGYGNFLVCSTYIDGVNTTIESDCL
ncbi:MAG: hypothetical protein KA138_03670 [Saprospiraceae bacterium]|nr:hypothetical protein [Saprospiraceae bacterium]